MEKHHERWRITPTSLSAVPRATCRRMHRSQLDEHRALRNRRGDLARAAGQSRGRVSARRAPRGRSSRRIIAMRAGRKRIARTAQGRRGFLPRRTVRSVHGEVPPETRVLLRVWVPSLPLRIQKGAARTSVTGVPVVSAFGPEVGWSRVCVADRRHALDVLDAVFHRNRKS